MKVAKFGGSSLADAEQIKKVCKIVLADPEIKYVVVSAPGKRKKDDIKVTDLLIQLAKSCLAGRSGEKELSAIIERFSVIAEELNVKEIMKDIKKDFENLSSSSTKDPEAFLDAMKSAGEDNCAKLVSAYLQKLGHKAYYADPRVVGMRLSQDYGKGKVLPESYALLAKLNSREGLAVFPGFFGCSPDGNVVTFSRGGSDITGSILAAATGASVYENWTDVDCVYAVNPALIKDPHSIAEITYDEMRELSYAGFSVMHEDALYPAFLQGIPVHIRNTNNPPAKGTTIVCKRNRFDSLVTGIAGKSGFCALSIKKYLMNQEVGFVCRALEIIAQEGISIEHMPSGIDSISIIIRSEELPTEKERRIIERLSLELKVDFIEVRRDLAIVVIVGEAMAKTVGTTARAATRLSKAGINLEIINQGASEISVMFGVREEYVDYAVKELYKEFFIF